MRLRSRSKAKHSASAVAEINRPRRHYLLKRLEARECDSALELVWRSKQEGEPGTPLPVGFPSSATLAANGYTTEEDLDGADEAELEATAGLRTYQATAVLSALAAL